MIHDTSIFGTVSLGMIAVVAVVAVLVGTLYVIIEWRKILEIVIGISCALVVVAIPFGLFWLVGKGIQEVLG